jgi:MoxR-like ATPase
VTSYGDSKNIELVDKAGQSIRHLLNKAADAADQNSRQALEAAQRLSQRLQAARDRIAQLDRDAAAHRDRAERAEAWLNKIHGEIKQQFPQGGRKAT